MTIIERVSRTEPATRVGADEFHRRHWLSLVRLAGALTGDRQAAEDVVQDVMIRMHGRWHRFDDENTALVYVRAAVVNGSRSHLRSLVRRRSVRPVEDAPVQPADQAVLARLESERVRRAVARLTRRQRESSCCGTCPACRSARPRPPSGLPNRRSRHPPPAPSARSPLDWGCPMTRERDAGADDLHRFLAKTLQSRAQHMFPDGTPVPSLGTRRPTRRRSVWPLVAVAMVTAIVVAASALVSATGSLTPAAGGIRMDPPCELEWADSASNVQFTVDGGDQTWRVWEQDGPDRRFCLSVDLAGGGSMQTSVPRDVLRSLQGAAVVSTDGRVYLWGLVTPAATRVMAEDASGTWSAAWTQPDLHVLPSALGVFVAPVDRATWPIRVTATSGDADPGGELVVAGS